MKCGKVSCICRPAPNRDHQHFEGNLEFYLRRNWARPCRSRVYPIVDEIIEVSQLLGIEFGFAATSGEMVRYWLLRYVISVSMHVHFPWTLDEITSQSIVCEHAPSIVGQDRESTGIALC